MWEELWFRVEDLETLLAPQQVFNARGGWVVGPPISVCHVHLIWTNTSQRLNPNRYLHICSYPPHSPGGMDGCYHEIETVWLGDTSKTPRWQVAELPSVFGGRFSILHMRMLRWPWGRRVGWGNCCPLKLIPLRGWHLSSPRELRLCRNSKAPGKCASPLWQPLLVS